MAVYLVTYDLNKETSRPNITEKIRSFGIWARLSESSYAISTDMTPAQVHAHFKPMLDDNDDFYVITLKQPYSGRGDKSVIEWLNNKLPW